MFVKSQYKSLFPLSTPLPVTLGIASFGVILPSAGGGGGVAGGEMFLIFVDHGMTFKDGQLVCFTIGLCSIFSSFSMRAAAC